MWLEQKIEKIRFPNQWIEFLTCSPKARKTTVVLANRDAADVSSISSMLAVEGLWQV
jgi:hypothetical protein